MIKKTSYGIINAIGGFVIARNYGHIQQYEKEMLILFLRYTDYFSTSFFTQQESDLCAA